MLMYILNTAVKINTLIQINQCSLIWLRSLTQLIHMQHMHNSHGADAPL